MRGSGGNGAILAKALKEFNQHWEATERTWRDRARTDFDKEYIQEINPLALGASNAMQQIEELLRHIRREVS